MKARKKKQSGGRTRSRRQHQEISLKSGLPPESLVHVGRVFMEKSMMNLISFTPENFTQSLLTSPEDLDSREPGSFHWLKVNGLHDVVSIGDLGKKLNISQLLLEDILNTNHRPKLEEDSSFLFFTLRFFSLEDLELQSEQVSFILGPDLLISFQESEKGYFDPILSRLANSTGKIRSKGLDYLLYNLIDVVVDHYYSILEKVGDQMEELEDQMLENPDRELIERNQLLRKNILALRKALIPTQEALYKLIKEEPDLIDETDLPYFSDVVDHVNLCLDFIETYRELSTEIKEYYLSTLSYRMNQVMKLLTIITSIFIPLSFIAGIYGMNFKFMPELEWRYGYFAVLGLMLSVFIGMLIYFRKKTWI
jgi:magnesium transporter